MFTILLAAAGGIWSVVWSMGNLRKEVDDFKQQMTTQLNRIESKLDNHAERISKLEERTSLIARR